MTADRPTHFFARQERARKSCRNQLILFIGAVFIIVFITTLALRFAWYLYLGTQTHTLFNAAEAQSYSHKLSTFTLFDPASFLFVAIVIVTVILTACLIKMNHLQQGGVAVAQMLGGRRISSKTTDSSERRLVNVVEEMAIASGIPVPKIYVMDSEYNINAFAAGLTLSDAAVTVTRGTLDKLTRDELQGVVAHEFSHILNGDMRLNVQLIGILYGILFLGIAGRKFLSGGRVSLRIGIPAMAAGLFLTVIGYIGSFLGRMLQYGISRQQEMLADASAVQFTRNPLGLAGALKKIGGSAFGSRIRSLEARQASHLFFSESHPGRLFDFLATHPPLTERIRLLDPSFDGKFIPVSDIRQMPKPEYASSYPGTPQNIPIHSPLLSMVAADVIGLVGNPSPAHISRGHVLLASLPEDIRESLKTPKGAACVIYALLVEENGIQDGMQMKSLQRALILQGDIDDVTKTCGRLSGLSRAVRLPLIEMAMPALSGLTSMEKRNFLLILNALVNTDGRISLFELSVQWILNKYLNPTEDMFRSITKFSYSQVGLDLVVLIEAIACAGHENDREKAQVAFEAGIARIPELAARKPVFAFEENASYAKVNRALNNLTASSFKIKESVIDACAYCAFADKSVTLAESELLRVIALALQCPLPPFVSGNDQIPAA
jgi:Zn-dependent protease with chaperone function